MTAVEPAASPVHVGDRARLERALRGVEAPFAIVDLDAFWANAGDLLRRAGGKPIRVASKSVRCRPLLRAVLDRDPGFRGVMAFTLPEALWVCEEGFSDLLVAYPTVDRAALRELGASERARGAVTLMVDSVEHLELIVAETGPGDPPARVCIDLDAGFMLGGGRVKVGAKRSPLRTPEAAEALAREIVARPALRLVGIMAYESQIAGVGDRPPGKPLLGRAIGAMQRASARELARRRGTVVEAVRSIAPLEFVNGGGTGSVERTVAEAAVTEVAAGSGLYGPTLFDAYSGFKPRPAALFALPVVRRPSPGAATVLGGGYLASGPGDGARLPRPYLPGGLKLDPQEGAGEVQTPVLGDAADGLALGDLVWFRHAKAGELCERFEQLHLVSGDEVVDVVPTYRGEGRCFL